MAYVTPALPPPNITTVPRPRSAVVEQWNHPISVSKKIKPPRSDHISMLERFFRGKIWKNMEKPIR